jgi:hypothetical protein
VHLNHALPHPPCSRPVNTPSGACFYSSGVSFDVFLQSFSQEGGGTAALSILEPFMAAPPDNGHAQLVLANDTADVYGLGSEGLMFNHIGDFAWDLIVQVARAERWVIMPAGCPTCVLDQSVIAELPEELRPNAAVIGNAADLHRVIAAS